MYYVAKTGGVEDPDYVETVIESGIVEPGVRAAIPSLTAPLTTDSSTLIAHSTHVATRLASCKGCVELLGIDLWSYDVNIENQLRNEYNKFIHDDPDEFCLDYLIKHGSQDFNRFVSFYDTLSIYQAKKIDVVSDYDEHEYRIPGYTHGKTTVDPSLVDRFGILFAIGFLISDEVFNGLGVDFDERYWAIAHV